MKQKTASRVLSLLLALCMVVGMAPAMTVTADAAGAALGNGGYPYGKDMDPDQITLVMEAEGTPTYQWQVGDSENGTFTDIDDAAAKEYTFTPQDGKWYRCVVDGTESKAVQTVKPPDYPGGTDMYQRVWTDPFNGCWYISNGTMAYTSASLMGMSVTPVFDVVGLYEKGGTSYMLSTSYNRCWEMTSSAEASPASEPVSDAEAAQLDTLRARFDGSKDHVVTFEADLTDGQQAFSFGCDAQLGDEDTSGDYYDKAALVAQMSGEALQQVAMIGAATEASAAEIDPAFVITPVGTAPSKFWIGDYSPAHYAYNTDVSTTGYTASTIGGQDVVTRCEGIDSGMSMAWLNMESGGKVQFQFRVGSVRNTGATGELEPEAAVFTDGLGKTNCTFDTYTKGGTNEKGYTFAGWFAPNGTELTSEGDAEGGTTYTAKWTKNGKTVRTTSLDLTAISEGNTLGATYKNGVYTNAAEGWFWTPGAAGGKLSLADCTIDVSGENVNAIKLDVDTEIMLSGTNSVTATGTNGCGINSEGADPQFMAFGDASLTATGSYRGILARTVRQQGGNVTASGTGGLDCSILDVVGGTLTANGTSSYGIYAHNGSGVGMTYGGVEIHANAKATATGDIGIVCGSLTVYKGDEDCPGGTLTAQGNSQAVQVLKNDGTPIAPNIGDGLVTKTNTEPQTGTGAYVADQIEDYKWIHIAAPQIPFFTDGLGKTDCTFDTYQKNQTYDKGYTFAGWFAPDGQELTSAADAVGGTTYTAKWMNNGKTVRTEPLFLTKIGTDNLQGATHNNGTYTNEAEGWTWDSGTKTLTFSGTTLDVSLAEDSRIAVHLPDGATVATAENTENVVSVRAEDSMGGAILGKGSLTFSGEGSLKVVGAEFGILTGGDIAINAPIEVSLTGENKSAAIWIDTEDTHSITIHEGLVIQIPTDGGITEDGLLICESDGETPATHVVIGPASSEGDTYTVQFNTNGGSAVASATVDDGGKLTKPADPTREGYTFQGWHKDAAFTTAWNFDSDTVTADMTLYAKWEEKPTEPTEPTEPTKPTHSISGSIQKKTDSTPENVSGATVELKRGNETVATATTGGDGKYSFSSVPAGEYNIVVTMTDGGKTKTKTILATISDSDQANVDILLPKGDVDSVVEVRSGTPAVVVGGLDDVAEAAAETGKSVTVKLEVETKAEASVPAAASTAIKAQTSGKALEYVDMTVLKTVKGSSQADVNTSIKETSKVLEIVVPFQTSGRNNITVFRHHENADGTTETKAFTKLTARPTESYTDGQFFVGDGFVVIYAQKFSTYAIGYDQPVTPPVTPVTPPVTPSNPGSGGSGGSGGVSPTTYSVNVTNPTNGSVTISPKNASRGTTVTITVTPDAGYEIGSVTVTDQNGKPISTVSAGSGKYTFTMPAGKVAVSATFTKRYPSYAECPRDNTCPIWPYTDASPAALYHDGVHYCIDNGYMVGYGGDLFGTDNTTSRAMIAAMLWRLNGSPVVNYALSFEDVAEDAWYTEAVRWAVSEGVADGYGNGKFGPNDPITCEQMVSMLYRYAQYKGYDVSVGEDTNILSYTDAESVSTWAIPAMQWACGAGLIKGNNERLMPLDNATRAQVAEVFMRYCEMAAE